MNKDSNDDDASCNRQVENFYNISDGIRIARGGGGRGMYAHADGDFHRFHGKYAPTTDTAAGQADISDSCSPAIGVDSFEQTLHSSGGFPSDASMFQGKLWIWADILIFSWAMDL